MRKSSVGIHHAPHRGTAHRAGTKAGTKSSIQIHSKSEIRKSYRYKKGFGESYEHIAIGDNNFEEILDTDLVFPGYLSWWGLDV